MQARILLLFCSACYRRTPNSKPILNQKNASTKAGKQLQYSRCKRSKRQSSKKKNYDIKRDETKQQIAKNTGFALGSLRLVKREYYVLFCDVHASILKKEKKGRRPNTSKRVFGPHSFLSLVRMQTHRACSFVLQNPRLGWTIFGVAFLPCP